MAKRLNAPKSDPAPIGHNSADVEEASRVQMISIMARLNAADADIEAAMAVVKERRNVRKSVIGAGKAAGYPAWELLRRQEEMARPKFEMAEQVSREATQRRWLDIITPEQQKMHLDGSTPEEVRDAADWRSEGYRAGLLNKPATLPDLMNGRFAQDFLAGHESGHKDFLLTLAENVPKPKNMTAQQVAEQAAREFKADNPDAPEPGSPEAKKLEREAIRKAKAGLDKLTPEDAVV